MQLSPAEKIRTNIVQVWQIFSEKAKDGGAHKNEAVACFKTGVPSAFLNSVVEFQPQNTEDIENLFTEAAQFFASGKTVPFGIYQESSQFDPDIQKFMDEQKLISFGEVQGLHRDLKDMNAELFNLSMNTPIGTVQTLEDLEMWSLPVAEAFHMDDISRDGYIDVLGATLHDQGFTHYFIMENNKPVSASTLFIHGDTASIYNCGTYEAYRGKGYMSALIVHMLKVARDHQCNSIVLQASPASTPIFKKFGFTKEVSYNFYMKS